MESWFPAISLGQTIKLGTVSRRRVRDKNGLPMAFRCLYCQVSFCGLVIPLPSHKVDQNHFEKLLAAQLLYKLLTFYGSSNSKVIPPLDPILSQCNPHIHTLYIFKAHYNIILPFMPSSSTWPVPSSFRTNMLLTSLLRNLCPPPTTASFT